MYYCYLLIKCLLILLIISARRESIFTFPIIIFILPLEVFVP